MRVQARWALGLASLALLFPAWAEAGPFDDGQPVPIANSYQAAPPVTGYQPVPTSAGYQQPSIATGYRPVPMMNGYPTGAMANRYPSAGMSGGSQGFGMNNGGEAPLAHEHHGLFGWRHCVECQRARVKRRDGVDVPPPPSLGPGMAMPGQAVATSGGRCAACEAAAVSGPVMAVDPHAPGYAVGGGPAGMAGGAPGYAVVAGNGAMSGAPGYAVAGGAAGMGGAEPAPIGVARSTQPRWANSSMAAYGARAGGYGYDPAVMPSSIPPPQDAVLGPGHPRPRVIGHLLGIPEFGGRRRAREEQARAKHAAIAYDQPNTPVTELPASMVYGGGNKSH
jgi:hypothetical protein